MKRAYVIGIVVNLVAYGAAELYFGTIFNESVRHALDLPALLYAAPGLLLNRILRLGLHFDGPSHSGILCLSMLLFTLGTCIVIVAAKRMKRKTSQEHSQPGRQ